MKKLCFFLISIGIIMTVFYCFIGKPLDILGFGMPYIIAAIGLPVCEKKKHMFPITCLLIFITIYNLAYFVARPFHVDLMHVMWRIPIQYVLPLLIGNILQYQCNKKE